MSLTPHSFQDRNYPSGFQDIDPNNSHHFSESQSQENQAIAASINEISESTYQSPSQQLAIETLRDLEDSKVFELLSFLRLPNHINYPYPEGLSSEQIDALSCLKYSPDSHISLWLGHFRVAGSQSRNPHISGLPTPQSDVTSGFTNGQRRPLRTNAQPSFILSGQFPASGFQTTHDTTGNSLGRRHFLNNNPQQLFTQEARPSLVTDVRPWRCVNMFCQKHVDRIVYDTCDGWKRHMKEHETFWPCMPYGPLKNERGVQICALCGSTDPNKSHMAGHSIGDCGDTTTKLRGVSRRSNLEKHLLRSHAVSADRTRGLADQWKTTARKKHFSCGFCVCIFSTIHQQLNHIDVNHFKKGQQITEWSASKVIRGLLLSPNVASSFQHILFSGPYSTYPELHWDSQMIEGLQKRLEMVEHPPETLAFEAYTMLTFDLSRQNPDGTHPPMSFSRMNSTSQSNVAIGPFDVSVETLENNSEHQAEKSTQGSEHRWFPDEHRVAALFSSYSKPNYCLSMNQIDTSEARPSITCQRLNAIVPTGFPNVSARSGPRLQPVYPPIRTGSTSSISEHSSTSAYDSSGTSTHLQATPLTTPSILHSTGAADMLGEQPNIYEGPTQKMDAAGTLVADLDNFAKSPSLEGGFFPLDTCDPRDLIKKPR